MTEYIRLAVGAAVLLAIALAVLASFRVGKEWGAARAVGRAALQLAFVAVVLRSAIHTGWGAALVVAVMFTVAAVTAYRRISALDRSFVAAVFGCAAGSVVSIGIIVGVPVLTRDLRTLIAVSGIIIGGCMTAVTLTGRHLRDGMVHRRGEIEGWLAIGATPREALRDISRRAAGESLIPGHDQTRTVGLVSLPGAFVGALLAGADAGSAARFQFVVLTGLICAQAVAAVVAANVLTSSDRLALPQPEGR
ncbi:MAG: ABC transporter permease [Gordonia polyisoprenivorans]|nr:ABC transporter permease [Gordonia polyisoprenivorans]